MKYGELIKKRRKEMNITQQYLAILVDMDRTYIAKMENNDRFPSLQGYALISAALNIKGSDFEIEKYIPMKIRVTLRRSL